MNVKSKERLERKKRKIKAFLEVAKLNDGDKKEDVADMSPALSHSTKSSLPMNPQKKNYEPMGDEALRAMRAEMKERQKKSAEKSKVYVTLDWVTVPCVICTSEISRVAGEQATSTETMAGEQATSTETMAGEQATSTETIVAPHEYYQPLFPVDLQHLILYALEGNVTPFKPRWCRLLRPSKVSQVVVMEIPDVTKQMFLSSQHSLPHIKQLQFDMCVEVISPLMYDSTFLTEIMDVAVSRSKLKEQLSAENKKDKLSRAQGINVCQTIPAHLRLPERRPDKIHPEFNRVQLLLSPKLLVLEGIPLPIDLDKARDYVYSCEDYGTVTPKSPMFAVDCEMCLTTSRELELTHIAVMNEQLETVYEKLVKPHNRIVNYLTKYSGITQAILKNVKTRLCDVQTALQEILPSDAILCGQSISGDLRAMKMFHPYLIDTSVIYNLTGNRHLKPGLKRLAATFLDKSIQDNPSGHDPKEDAQTTMELVLLKLKEGADFGDLVLGGSLVPESEDVQSPKKQSEEKNTDQSDLCVMQSPDQSHERTNQSDADVDNSGDNSGEPPHKKPKSDFVIPSDSCGVGEQSGGEASSSEDERSGDDKGPDMKGRPDPDHVTRQQKMFFQKQGSGVKQSLLAVAQSCHRKVCVIAEEKTLEDIRKAPEAESAHLVAIDTNKSCRKACRSATQDGEDFLVWAQFCGADKDEEEESRMSQIDRWVKKVMDKCRSNSMLIVLLAGKPVPSSHSNTVCLVKMT